MRPGQRRRGPRPVGCDFCGGAGPSRWVRLQPLTGPAPARRLALCERCMNTADATWRLRWRLDREAA